MKTVQGLKFLGFYKGNTLDIAPSGEFFVKTSRRTISVCDFKSKQVLCQADAKDNIVCGISPDEKHSLFTEKGETRLTVRDICGLNIVSSIDVERVYFTDFFSDSEILFLESCKTEIKCCCWDFVKNEIRVVGAFSRNLKLMPFHNCSNGDGSISFLCHYDSPKDLFERISFDNKEVYRESLTVADDTSIESLQKINNKMIVCERKGQLNGSTCLYDFDTHEKVLLSDKRVAWAFMLSEKLYLLETISEPFGFGISLIDVSGNELFDFSGIKDLKSATVKNSSNDDYLILRNAYGSFVFKKCYEPIPDAQLTIPALNCKLPGTEGFRFGKFTIK